MVRNSLIELPGTEHRVAAILSDKTVRRSLAELASKRELVNTRSAEFASDALIEHLSKPRTAAEDTQFFATRGISEAIILEKTRPVLLIQDGIVAKAKLESLESDLAKVRDKLVIPIRSVGRVELSDHDTFEWCGTAWRIDDDLLVTNRHVANLFAQQSGATFKFRLNQAGKRIRARVDFREEYRGTDSDEFGIAEILWIAEDTDLAPDMAVLRVKKDPGLPPPLTISSAKIAAGQPIGVVGYPARDSRNDASVMSDIFGDIYDVKRFAPGEVRLAGAETWYLTHDASTLGGNSGSAVIDLSTREVVGLHFGGSYKKTNYAVTAAAIKSVLAKRSWIEVSHESLKIQTEAFSEKVRTVASMKNRKGYQAEFLGKKVVPPKAGPTHTILKAGFPDDLLPYTHFSILMSQSRRFSIFTLENLDGEKKIKLKRKDAWGFDPRIAKSAQVGHDEFYGPELFDKGHMVRRENPGWSDSEEEASLGENDSFIYTNAIPQMPQLNQQTWLSLENYVLDNAKTAGFKICVFTGPVFRNGDTAYSNVQVPTDFWKVVVAIDADSQDLLASGYLLSQEGMMPEEGFRYGAFKTYQVPLKRIQQLADIKFSKPTLDADVFSGPEINEMIHTARYVEIRSSEDIVLTKRRT